MQAHAPLIVHYVSSCLTLLPTDPLLQEAYICPFAMIDFLVDWLID